MQSPQSCLVLNLDFDPESQLFDARHRGQILLSDAGLAVMISALCVFGHYAGVANVVKFYAIPYLLVNHWLVMVSLRPSPECAAFVDDTDLST